MLMVALTLVTDFSECRRVWPHRRDSVGATPNALTDEGCINVLKDVAAIAAVSIAAFDSEGDMLIS